MGRPLLAAPNASSPPPGVPKPPGQITATMPVGAPAPILLRMIVNVVADSAVGSVPIAGDLFDVVWKANRRNMELLLGHARGRRKPRICS